ncbi:fungal family protein [Schizosaccharomyces cryophilus OY26]|uniref:Fungal family protein n=1 Tax=Schizosaccharomyces cryophilus (strain OY26 / ATCC MYA-4695 / CBS 11777 / NBRC 106824 / NRRL Y48691) TaxID=653667 RepID=S9W296_SCHCR|nr:fungal family protein [Schizosaccharomyces cryophilus OY26]EPY52150.1 fungal family protein [Schizosaccharomyces cryophilus OY26]
MEQKKDASVLSNQFQSSIGISRNIIRSWLGEEAHSIDNEGSNEEVKLQARPSRLGLGAMAKESSANSQFAFKNERLKSLPATLRKKIERQLQKKESVKSNAGTEQSSQKRKRETERDTLKGQENDAVDEGEEEDEDSRIQVANKSKRNINQGSGFDLYKRLNKRK